MPHYRVHVQPSWQDGRPPDLQRPGPAIIRKAVQACIWRWSLVMILQSWHLATFNKSLVAGVYPVNRYVAETIRWIVMNCDRKTIDVTYQWWVLEEISHCHSETGLSLYGCLAWLNGIDWGNLGCSDYVVVIVARLWVVLLNSWVKQSLWELIFIRFTACGDRRCMSSW